MPRIIAALFVTLLLAVPQAGCKQDVPSPWKEMKLPLHKGEILPGADADNLRVQYGGTEQRQELFEELRRRLERAGYSYDREGKAHDPPGNAFAGIYKQGAVEILVTISGAGSGKTNVVLKRLD